MWLHGGRESKIIFSGSPEPLKAWYSSRREEFLRVKCSENPRRGFLRF